MSYPVTTKGDNTVLSYWLALRVYKTVGTLCSCKGPPLSPKSDGVTRLSSSSHKLLTNHLFENTQEKSFIQKVTIFPQKPLFRDTRTH